MNNINELLNKANQDKKKTLLKEEQKQYRMELIEKFQAEGLSEVNIFYFVSGLKFGTVNSFVNWNRNFEKGKQVENLNILIASQKVKALDNLGKLKMFLMLLVLELNENELNDEIIGELLHWMVDLSFKKDGTRLADLGRIFRNCFMSGIKYGTKLPVLNSYNFTKEYEKQLVCFFEDAVKGIEPKGDGEIEKRNILRNWIDKESARIRKTNDSEQIETEVIENKNDSKVVDNVNNSKNDTVEITSILGKRLLEMAKTVDSFDRLFRQSEENLKTKDHEIARVKTSHDKLESLYKSSVDENEKLRKELGEVKGQLEKCMKEKKELEDRVNRQVSVIAVYDQDKANTKTELLNQIAATLKKIYADYKVAELMPMTIDLGENMRDALDDVFRKLKKIGIDIERR